MARVICITSGKGGVGKTTITANLGTALALSGNRVCLIDADFGLRNLDIPLGLSNRVIYHISDFLTDCCALHQVIVKDKRISTLAFISCSNDAVHHDDPQIFREVVQQVARGYDYVLIDSPAGIENGFWNAALAADEAIVVTTPHRTSLQDADRVIGLLEDRIPAPPQLIINMADEQESSATVKMEDIIGILNIGVIGVIHADVEIIRSVHKGIPIALNPEFESGLRFRHIAHNVAKNQQEPFISLKSKKHRSIFSLSQRLRWGENSSL
ncbi:septum site-determining protein MinD [Paenibacillus sp. FSL R5-0766]|uniref:septum site-determining protein MinD n=1 Tax=unclassified Paenibacillus TaxID=185978 RepID=UPI00096E2DBD|nr:septum site-determining protein MinD [Paenibacillus sp. FSL R5-0765]OMF62942.1 septum site-determining protein MinD [Paenibacillus sp. FSL R5-0765]